MTPMDEEGRKAPGGRAEDRALEALVREAAALEIDTEATTRAVLARIDAERGAAGPARLGLWLSELAETVPAVGPGFARVAFVALLLASGALGYALPDLVAPGTEARLWGVAVGDLPVLDFSGLPGERG